MSWVMTTPRFRVLASLWISAALVTCAIASPARAEAPSPEYLSGPVQETMNSGGYTYVRIDGPDGAPAWAAGPLFDAKELAHGFVLR